MLSRREMDLEDKERLWEEEEEGFGDMMEEEKKRE